MPSYCKNLEPEAKTKKIGSENTKKTCFRLVSGLVQNPNLNIIYIQKYKEPRSEIWTQIRYVCLLYTIEIPDLETFQKKVVAKIPRRLVLKKPISRIV
jgi:hypothetical protein